MLTARHLQPALPAIHPARPAAVAGLGSQAPDAARANDWGWLFPLLVVGAAGVFLVALADDLARHSAAGAQLIFFSGLLVTYVPLALRALAPGASREERIALIVALGLLLSLVKLLMQPTALTYVDELMHWRSLIDLQQTGHLFTSNPLLPISPQYPGLESATAALIGATGLPAATAAQLLVRAAKLVLLLALYLFLEKVTGTPRRAAAGSVVYLGNPGFVFFDSQFTYESMALGLAAVILFLAARRGRGGVPRVGSLLAVAILALALAMTHHVTSIALLGLLVVWSLGSTVARAFGRERGGVLSVMLVVLAAEALWFAVAGRMTFDYLSVDLERAFRGTVALLEHRSAGRHLFQAAGGQTTALPWQILGLGSAVLIVLALPLGGAAAWKQRRFHSSVWMLALACLAYAGSLGLHLAPAGAEIGSRMSPFVFLGVGSILGFAIDRVWPREPGRGARLAVLTGWLSVVFLGGLIVGWQPMDQLPGPYLVGANGRSMNPAGVSAATWTGGHLGSRNRFAADVTNRNLVGSYGHQDTVTYFSAGVSTAPLFLSPTFNSDDLAIVREGRVRYVLVDRRLGTARPLTGVYFEDDEPSTRPPSRPIPASWLDKFNSIPGVSRVYDNGDIRIYDLGGLLK